MKHNFIAMLIALALALSFSAFAEGTEPELPAEPAPAEQTEQAEQPRQDAALQEAYDALRAAKQAAKLEALEAELKGYVEAGTMTQEHADLILNDMKERQSRRGSACPGCGMGQNRQGGMGKYGRGMGQGMNGMGRGVNGMGQGMNGMDRGMNGMGGHHGRGMGGRQMNGQTPPQPQAN